MGTDAALLLVVAFGGLAATSTGVAATWLDEVLVEAKLLCWT